MIRGLAALRPGVVEDDASVLQVIVFAITGPNISLFFCYELYMSIWYLVIGSRNSDVLSVTAGKYGMTNMTWKKGQRGRK